MISITHYGNNMWDRYEDVQIETSNFPDNTLLLKTPGINFNLPIEITWNYENDSELFTLICLAKKARGRKTLFMPYCPHARMDRVKSNDDTFTLKYFAEVINSLGFERVNILDPHSSVCEALIDNIVVKSPKEYIYKVINDNFLDVISLNKFSLFFPDEGSCKRYSGMLNNPYTFGAKRRDWTTGQIQGLDVVGDINLIKDKTILIIDDICSRGGTFYHSAMKLKELGAKEIYLYVTHCENTILEGKLLTSGLIEKVFTTNSIFIDKQHEKIKVIDLI